MDISSVLLNPQLQSIKSQLEELKSKVDAVIPSQDQLDLKTHIEKELQEVESLIHELKTVSSKSSDLSAPENFFTSYRNLKVDLRFAKRTLERLDCNQERSAKMKMRAASHAA